MKSSAILVIGFGAVALLAIGYFLFSKQSTLPLSVKKEEISVMLYKESGFVTWRKASDTEYSRVTEDELTMPNDVYVKTVEGRAYVVLPDNSSISLDQNTEIHILYEPKHVAIEQLLGSTYHRVEALLQGETYEVRTPGTLAAVRGTKFSVTYDSKKKSTRVAVTEHAVAVAPIDTIEGVASSTLVKSINEGNIATLADKKEEAASTTQPARREITVASLEAVPEEKKWLDQNREVDHMLDKQKENNDKRETIKDLLKELKKEEEPQKQESAGSKAKSSDRIEVVKKAVRKVEIKQEEKKKENDAKKEEEPKATSTLPANTASTTIPAKPKAIPATTTTGPSALSPKARELKVFNMTTEVLNPEDQAFIDGFYSMYEKYLFVDDGAGVCERVSSESADSIISNLEKMANQAGYALPSAQKEQLLLLAKNVVASCKEGTVSAKLQDFQTQFDVAYPFSQ